MKTYKQLLRLLTKSKEIGNILKAIYRETLETKVGITLSKLSRVTRIERHKLVGIIETLVTLGILVITQIGMAKVVTFNPKIFQHVKEALKI